MCEGRRTRGDVTASVAAEDWTRLGEKMAPIESGRGYGFDGLDLGSMETNNRVRSTQRMSDERLLIRCIHCTRRCSLKCA